MKNITIDQVKEYFNCLEAEIDSDGDIWIENPMAGHWLTEEEEENLSRWVNASHIESWEV